MWTRIAGFGLLTAACGIALGAMPPRAIDRSLQREFLTPPDSAKPRVWWHWMNGNVTQEGIRLDIEWMKRIGIGGMNCIDASIDTPQVVSKRLIYMSPGWKTAFRYAATLAEKFRMELSIDSSPGWSETGGPWVHPAQAMKKLVWSETRVTGERRFNGTLVAPPRTTGPFQNIAYDTGSAEGGNRDAPPTFYADVGVIAYRLPESAAALPRPMVTSSAGKIDAALLGDGNLEHSVSLPAAADGTAWVKMTYEEPQTIRSAVLGTNVPGGIMAVSGPMTGRLEAQDERGAWRRIATLSISNVPQVTATFPPVTARQFRLLLSPGAARELPLAPAPGADTSMLSVIGWRAPAPQNYAVSEFSLLPTARIHEFERKAGFAVAEDYDALATPEDADNAPLTLSEVQDLSSKMAADGSLDWTPPKGEWVVLRFGYSLTGKTNNPATPEATGLEVDKLNRGHVQEYMRSYLDTFSNFLPPSLMGRHGLRAVTLDSTEVGPQNWTDDMLEQFQRLRGYNPRPWLPALAGVIVESAHKSDQFLWDFRRTIAQLTAEAHYAEVAAATQARGLTHYAEALELDRPVLGDDLQMRRYADVPTAAMWMYPIDEGPVPSFIADDRGAASIAHLYGQNLAAAESFTSAFAPWAFSPRDLKPIVDLEFALGINRIIVHTSVHQPEENPPGLSLAVFGQSFNRHDTWAQVAGPWISYLTRSSYLLQQGRYAADVAYFYGEETPLTILQSQERLNDVPSSYAFDFVNTDALLNLLKVRDGHLVTPSGMRYRALQLGGASTRMTLSVLRRLKDLVQQGALVVGRGPEDSPSLIDDEAEFQRLKNELWGSDGRGSTSGLGRVYGDLSVESVLRKEGLPPDLTYSRSRANTELKFLHRTLPEGEIYFLSNRKNQAQTVDVSFRVTGRLPELWHAQTGETEPASFRVENGRTTIPMKFDPYEAVFVVFRKVANTSSREVPQRVSRTLSLIRGRWTLRFQPDRGAPPATIIMEYPQSWSMSADPGIKYFSGTATYQKTIDASQTWFKLGMRLLLDLGDVREVAEVEVNGKPLGIVWNPPYRVDVTKALHPGRNRLAVKVTNLWVNRLVGDQQPGARKIAFATFSPYRADAPLRASGLLAPVSIVGMAAVGRQR